MTFHELKNRMRELVAQERGATVEILELIREAEKKRLFLAEAFSSTFDWLVREFGYSEPAAYRRIHASRLLARTPLARVTLERGTITLSVASLVQETLRREEKRTRTLIPCEKTEAVLSRLEGKSKAAAEAFLGTEFPELVSRKQSLHPLNEEESQLNVVLSRSARATLERTREFLSHAIPDPDWGEVIETGLDDFLDRWDPLRRPTQSAAAAAAGSSITAAMRAHILQRAGGRCEYLSAEGVRCESRYQIEIDHIHPKALGGTNDPANLRALCRAHNQHEARRHGL